MATRPIHNFGKVRRNKFHVGAAEKRTYRGWTFHSIAECLHARELDMLLDAKAIDWWLRQVPIDLTDDDRFKVDFVISRQGMVFAQEVKGYETNAWLRTRKLWLKYGPFPCEVIRSGKTFEVLEPYDA